MDRTDTGAGQHRLKRFGDHGHVDDDAITLFDALGAQCTGQASDAVAQFEVADLAFGVGDRAVIDDRGLVATTCLDVAVHGVPTGVDLGIRKPLVQGGIVVVQSFGGLLVPVNRLGLSHPEPLGVVLPALVNILIAHAVLLQILLRQSARAPRGVWASALPSTLGRICKMPQVQHHVVCKPFSTFQLCGQKSVNLQTSALWGCKSACVQRIT